MQEAATRARRPRTDWVLVTLLLLLAGGLHAWLMAHTVVAARDSIGYIRFALWLENEPWGTVLNRADQHPGYPLAVLLASKPVRHFLGGTSAESMVVSAQLASAVAGTLLVLPMFYLGRLLFDRRAGFWAAVLFQALPVSAHVLGDALSEATFFLLLTTTLLLAAVGLRRRSVVYLALCGLCGGLAYLTRPEGALAVAAALVVLLGMQRFAALRWPRRRVIVGALALSLSTLAVAGPYVATIGRLTPKPTPNAMGNLKVKHETGVSAPAPQTRAAPAKPPLRAMILADWMTIDIYGDHETFVWRGLVAVLRMTSRAFQYVVWVPALAGLWWFRRRLLTCPGLCVVLVLCGMQLLVLWRMAAVVGYVSERHALVLLLGGSFWAAAMLTSWADWLSLRLPAGRWQPAAVVGMMAVATCFALPSTLKPMHANRACHKAAGLWLASHAGPDDIIVDPYCWAHYYAGKVFLEGRPPSPDPLPVHWVVLENSDNPHDRLRSLGHAEEIARLGALVERFVPSQKERKSRAEEVDVYRFPPPASGK